MSPLNIRMLDSRQPDFKEQLGRLLAWDEVSDQHVQARVAQIVEDIKAKGDQALLEYTRRFDNLDVSAVKDLEISKNRIQDALAGIEPQQKQALELAAQRIKDYHQRQLQNSWQYQEPDGTILGQKITAMERVGVYVPGGKAAYPSTVLMNSIPAKVAGVAEVVMVVPAAKGEISDVVLAAAAIAGVDRVFNIGGAQAVAALAYGTETVPKVDKIVGPGNIYVATAKKMVFGAVGIDMIAGPSEILVVCDGKTDRDWIVMDLFSQAEHDENAQSILVSTDQDFLDLVRQGMEQALQSSERADILRQSLEQRGALIKVADLEEACEIINRIAPEHLELSVEDPEALLPDIDHAGAIFMGRYTAEALGDYCAGPNHVLPTSGTARFSSPLGVYDFQKRSSIINCSAQSASDLGKAASVLARSEGLIAHARSAEFRIKK